MNQSLKVLLLSLSLFLPTFSADAYQILFYCNSSDNVSGMVRHCVPILEKAGHRVTVIDMKGRNHDPARDNWGAPYDQVWDMRFVNRDSTVCGSGRTEAADYFDERWRAKAVQFLNHCGKLFISGEYFTYVDRNEGLYRFLGEIGAVKRGYDPCPPSSRGNSETSGPAIYPVHPGLGPVSFYGDFIGGIPLDQLTGTSFVDTDEGWLDDSVARSVVCAWKGNQLGEKVNVPLCDRGKLFMLWDATMWQDGWTKRPNPIEQEGPAIWEDQAWQPGQIDTQKTKDPALGAREVTTKFFPAIARWLGGGVCPCGSPVPEPPIPTMTPVLLLAKTGPTPVLTLTPLPLAMLAPLSMNGAQTIVFNGPPINIFMKFKDGAGNYRLDIYDSRGDHLNNPYSQAITLEKEAWASWDGTNGQGILESFGQYYAYLSKDGKFLRKIVLNWVRP